MFGYSLLAFAAAAIADAGGQVIIVDGQPTIRLSLATYDLGRHEELRRLKLNIQSAAGKVCARAYRDAAYPEVVACAKGAAANAEAQLSVAIARNSPASPLLSAIAITAPAK